MDFDSPEEKEFPGLYASEAADSKSKKSKEESDYSEGGSELGKKDLLSGRRKDKKEKGKDRGYAALEGESSPEEELDTKSPNKSKKSKSFMFTSSKSKEKREKSRDKDKDVKDDETTKEKDKDHKKKDKERKEKEKKEKSKDKDKDKKDKKLKQTHSGNESDLESELALCYPIFGVSVSLAVERSRCHDGIELPLVVRECIDYLQENSLSNPYIYKVEPYITDILHFKRLYNRRERKDTDKLDTPTACSLLRLFIKELPEPILTTDLTMDFEMIATHARSLARCREFVELIKQLPKCNQTLLAWVLLHLKDVTRHVAFNKLNVISISMLLHHTLQMSHRLMVSILCDCSKLFPGVVLVKYVPPLSPPSPKLPEKVEDIQIELSKQESLLAQIHHDMNAGFITKKLEEQLWEVQRIITQLKRKLRSFEKKQEKSIEELDAPPPQPPQQQQPPVAVATTTTEAISSKPAPAPTPAPVTVPVTTSTITVDQDTTDSKAQQNNDLQETNKIIIVEEVVKEKEKEEEFTIKSQNEIQLASETPEKIDTEQTPQATPMELPTITETTKNNADGFYIDTQTGLLLVPKSHPNYKELLRLQLEYQELLAWKLQLQAKITEDRAETLILKHMHAIELAKQGKNDGKNPSDATTMPEDTEVAGGDEYDKVVENYVRENKLLEAKKVMLAKELFDEKRELIELEVEFELQKW